MGQVLHGSATTTEAIRRAIHSQESLRALAERYGVNQKTVAKWKNRDSVADLPTGPKEPTSPALSIEQEAIIVAFRRQTLLPLDDCLYSLQATIPHLTRSSLHRCLQRRGISRLPEVEGDKPNRRKHFHIDIAEVQTPPIISRDASRPSKVSHPTSSSAKSGQKSPNETIHHQSDPAKAGTKHLEHPAVSWNRGGIPKSALF